MTKVEGAHICYGKNAIYIITNMYEGKNIKSEKGT